MKYTKYIIYEDWIDLDSLQPKYKIFEFPTIVLKIIVAVCGLAAITGLILPVTILVDEYRSTKYYIIRFKRKGYNLSLIKNYFIHLPKGLYDFRK